MNYKINLLLNSTILSLLTIKPFIISAINIVSHILTSTHSATLNQFALISETQYLYYHILFDYIYCRTDSSSHTDCLVRYLRDLTEVSLCDLNPEAALGVRGA